MPSRHSQKTIQKRQLCEQEKLNFHQRWRTSVASIRARAKRRLGQAEEKCRQIATEWTGWDTKSKVEFYRSKNNYFPFRFHARQKSFAEIFVTSRFFISALECWKGWMFTQETKRNNQKKERRIGSKRKTKHLSRAVFVCFLRRHKYNPAPD